MPPQPLTTTPWPSPCECCPTVILSVPSSITINALQLHLLSQPLSANYPDISSDILCRAFILLLNADYSDCYFIPMFSPGRASMPRHCSRRRGRCMLISNPTNGVHSTLSTNCDCGHAVLLVFLCQFHFYSNLISDICFELMLFVCMHVSDMPYIPLSVTSTEPTGDM